MAELSKFKRTINGTDIWYAFLEVPNEMLDTPIPQAALDSFYGVDEEGNSIKTGILLRDFALCVVDLQNGRSIISMAAKYAPDYRHGPVTEADLSDWVQYIGAHGYSVEDLMTADERRVRIDECLGTEE